MERTVSAADANRRFSEILRRVRSGESVVVTSHGKPVARILPVVETEGHAKKAREAFFARMSAERVAKVGRWKRDELYEDSE